MPARFCTLPAVLAFAVSFAIAQEVPSVPTEEPEPTSTLPEEQVQPERPGAITRSLSTIWQWSDAQVRGIFDVVLPDTQERGTWKLSVQPRVFDLIDDEYVRVPMGVTYGFNRRTEGEFEIDGYFGNPTEKPEESNGVGIANYRLSFKRKWKPTQGSQINAATNVQFVWPDPSSPAQLNHGVNRTKLLTAFSRKVGQNKQNEGILNLSYDFLTPSSADGWIPEDRPQDDYFRIAPGVLHHRGRFTYGLAAGWEHTVDGEAANYFTVTPSVIYEIPSKYVFNSPGRWQLGLAVEGKHYLDEYDVEFRVRVRWLGSISRVYKDWRDSRRAAAAARVASSSER
ncbi:MAG: hypothetical protein IAE82_09405 [Opitutaceae bacterium]|nr:hypothetical protein [Opitutaceae bacterium]